MAAPEHTQQSPPSSFQMKELSADGSGRSFTRSFTTPPRSASQGAPSPSQPPMQPPPEPPRSAALSAIISQDFVCPLSGEVMVDPVMASDGFTYEKSVLERWLTAAHSVRSSRDSDVPVLPAAVAQRIARLDPSAPLIENKLAKAAIETLLLSEEVGEEIRGPWLARRRTLYHAKAQALFEAGQVEAAAELGLAAAQGLMAARYSSGSADHGVAQDLRESVRWAQKAADGGDVEGQYLLGLAYDQGEGGLATDWSLAVRWYEKAAKQGHDEAMLNIGCCYDEGGHWLAKNVFVAAYWLSQAAEAGNPVAQHKLGCYYRDGIAMSRDFAVARAWLSKAAERGDDNAETALALMLVRAQGGDRDLATGLRLWRNAAEKGNKRAAANMEILEALLRNAQFY